MPYCSRFCRPMFYLRGGNTSFVRFGVMVVGGSRHCCCCCCCGCCRGCVLVCQHLSVHWYCCSDSWLLLCLLTPYHWYGCPVTPFSGLCSFCWNVLWFCCCFHQGSSSFFLVVAASCLCLWLLVWSLFCTCRFHWVLLHTTAVMASANMVPQNGERKPVVG